MLALRIGAAALCLTLGGSAAIARADSTGAAAPSEPSSSAGAAGASSPERPAPHGTLGPSVALESSHLGYTVHVRVYEPAGELTRGALPVLYVTDGSDYWKPELGDIVPTLDALIASGRIAPVVAVFIDAWDPVVRRNRRYEQFLPAGTETREPFVACPFCDFIADEVVPWVEARREVDPLRRGILGASLGGLNAAYMALTRPELFHVVGIQSPSIFREPWLPERIAHAADPPERVAIEIGAQESLFLPGARALRDAYAARSVPLQYRELPADHSWRHWRASVGDVLQFLYGMR